MLDDTAVVVLSEHGRTPRLQNVTGGGRDHWARAYSAAFAGGGFAKGRVIGRTDRHGGTSRKRRSRRRTYWRRSTTSWASTRTRRSTTASAARYRSAARAGAGELLE